MTATPPLQHLPTVPYSDPPSRLRTLDIWLPPPNEQPTSSLPWIIYIHGGAWRDPSQDSTTCVKPTIQHILSTHSKTISQIGGIASLNYRLSPYPTHPTHPSDPNDEERNAKHPQHIRDVAQGIQYLQRKHGVTRWIGIGHSCGATLLLQLVAGIGLEESSHSIIGPEALLLLEGIYNFPLFLRNHAAPAYPNHIAKIYETMLKGAFGEDTSVYQALSPVAGKFSKEQWPEGRLLVIGHSYEDELVERAQRDVMCVALDREGWSIVMEEGDEEDEVRAEGRRVLNVRDMKGSHDYIWKDGQQIALLIAEVVQRLS
ncbi:hypothetical protein NX059_006768 [Plenodomus lindquistii]|nr:hypothetical protein NX059_006768 [Plenodomus lindquistii]